MHTAKDVVVLIRSVFLIQIAVSLGCSSLGQNAKNGQIREIEHLNSAPKEAASSDAFAKLADHSKSSDDSMSTTIVSMSSGRKMPFSTVEIEKKFSKKCTAC